MSGELNCERIGLAGMTKVKRYDWTVQDQPGILRMINKRELTVDDSYQRESNKRKVLEIAKDWSWIACGAIIVGEREGKLYVIDGQHRILAALNRSDITLLPCIVFHTLTYRVEAKGFYNSNTNRRSLLACEKMPSMISMGMAEALLVEELIQQSGRRRGKSSGITTVQCTGMLLKWAKNRPDILRKVWTLICEVSRGHVMNGKVVDGLLYIEKNLQDGESLMEPRNYKRVLKVGMENLANSAAKAAAFFSKGGANIWAMGLLEAINKGCAKKITINHGE